MHAVIVGVNTRGGDVNVNFSKTINNIETKYIFI